MEDERCHAREQLDALFYRRIVSPTEHRARFQLSCCCNEATTAQGGPPVWRRSVGAGIEPVEAIRDQATGAEVLNCPKLSLSPWTFAKVRATVGNDGLAAFGRPPRHCCRITTTDA